MYFLLSILMLGQLSWALEVSQIMEAKGTPASCGDPGYFPQPPSTPPIYDLGSCNSCKAAIDSEVNSANGVLAGAKMADGTITANAQAATAAQAALTSATQDDPQGRTSNTNNLGSQALQQQQAEAMKVSQAMKKCAQEIRSKCAGNLANQDQQAGKTSADSCENSGRQADQTAAEKQAAQDPANQNKDGSQGNQDKGGSMPPPPPPPPGGDQQETPKSPIVDKPNVVAEKPKQLAGTSLSNNGMKEGIGIGSQGEGSTSNSGNPNSNYTSGISPSSAVGAGNVTPTSAENTSSTSSTGSSSMEVSGGRGLGSSSGGPSKQAASNPAEAANTLAKGDESTSSLFSSPSFSGPRPALGISTTGDELVDLLKPAKLASNESQGNIKLAHATRDDGEVNLFHRIKSKLNKISIDRHMQ